MKKLQFLLLHAILLQCSFISKGQFTRQEAIDLVINQILVKDTGHINVYSSYDSISSEDSLILFDNRKLSLPYPNNWVFLSDDNPLAYWYHPCRYVIINANNGDYSTTNSDIFPLKFQNYFESILSFPIPSPIISPCNEVSPVYPPSNSQLHAVLICGVDELRMNIDIAEMYNTLREAGYSRDNINVLYSEGIVSDQTIIDGCWWGGDFDNDGIGDIYGSAYKEDIDAAFSNLSQSIGSEDQLLVYVSAHGQYVGNMSQFRIPGSDVYTSADLVTAVQPIGCAQMIFIFQPCYSGEFITALSEDSNSLCKNRIIQTSVDEDNPAMDEWYITGGHCGEFTFYLAAAMRGYYMYDYLHPMKWGCRTGSYPFDEISWINGGGVNVPHPPDYNPDHGDPVALGYENVINGNADGYTQFNEAFHYADCMDSWSVNGYYNPNPPGAPPTSGMDCPQHGIDDGFRFTIPTPPYYGSDDLYCLNGIAGNTSTNAINHEILGRSYLLGGNLNIHSNTEIKDNAQIKFGVDNAVIDVDANSTLSIGLVLTLKGTGSSSNPNGLLIENDFNSDLSLEDAHFTSVYLMTYGSELIINQSILTDLYVFKTMFTGLS